mgnify:CR=1 FL=1
MVKKKRVPIIFEDDAIIVCEKPAGMPVQSDHGCPYHIKTPYF